ncbi:signal peptidase I [Staphylococcus epidermidis]|uniref:signal peptidase I n=1 Tax=Staphylococcus epidermidis TaxID=1282 RepID=UPI00294B4AC0|nr:signal peptidase I [Staphylococcus epidermidis]
MLALLTGVVIAILLTTFVGSRYTVKGDSMYPTFKDGEELIVNKLSVPFHKLDRGDVVIFHATKKGDYIKRLIGKPGDKVKYYKDKLYVNGKNKYLVLGDNRLISNDSRRDVGLLDKDKVVGKVFVRLLPLSDFKFDFYSKSFNKVNK